MNNYGLFILLTLLGNSGTFAFPHEEFNEECKKVPKPPVTRLKEYLTCNFDIWTGPNEHQKRKTPIEVSIAPVLTHFDEESSDLHLGSIFALSWIDKRLSWNMSDFNNLSAVHIPNYDIWEPDIAILSVHNVEDYNHQFYKGFCMAEDDGSVTCMERIYNVIKCQTDFTEWPYDRQTCLLVISSWAHTTDEIDFRNNTYPLYLYAVQGTGDWLVGVSRIFFDERKSSYHKGVTFPQLTIEFVVDRIQSNMRGRFIAPAIVMMVMTLTTVWLDAKSTERLAIACVNLLVHFLCVQDLHWYLPLNGTSIPNILRFYVNSFTLAALAFLLTFLLRKINDSKASAPAWIVSNTSALLKTRPGQYLLLGMLDPKATAGILVDEEEVDTLVSPESTNTTTWKYVAVLIGWLSFFVFLFTYTLCYSILMPKINRSLPMAFINTGI